MSVNSLFHVTIITLRTRTMSFAEREGQGYTFYRQTGSQARLSNSFRTAERHLARVEFQNAVVMSSVALEDDRPFQVLIESKVNTWSGSIIIGEKKQIICNLIYIGN